MPVEVLVAVELGTPLLGLVAWKVRQLWSSVRHVRNVTRSLGGRGRDFTLDGVSAHVLLADGLTTTVRYDWTPPESIAFSTRQWPFAPPPVGSAFRPIKSEADPFEGRSRVACDRPELARAILDDKTLHRLAQAEELTLGWLGSAWVVIHASPDCAWQSTFSAHPGVVIACGCPLGTNEAALAKFVGLANDVFRHLREVMQPLKKIPPLACVNEDARCPLCAGDLATGLLSCPGCRTLYHEACRARVGACVMPGCPESRLRLAGPDAGSDPAIAVEPLSTSEEEPPGSRTTTPTTAD